MSLVADAFNAALQINKKNIKVVIVIVVLLLVMFPIINSLWIKPSKVGQKIDLLEKVAMLDQQSLTSPQAIALRQSINQDIESLLAESGVDLDPLYLIQREPWKFISGAFLWIVVFLILPFQKQKATAKVPAMLLVLIIGVFTGYIGTLIPTLLSPFVNYIAFPILQLVFLFSAFKIEITKQAVA